MAENIENTKEKAESSDNLEEFDLDSELENLVFFLQEMGVELEEEAETDNELADETSAGAADKSGGELADWTGDGSADRAGARPAKRTAGESVDETGGVTENETGDDVIDSVIFDFSEVDDAVSGDVPESFSFESDGPDRLTQAGAIEGVDDIGGVDAIGDIGGIDAIRDIGDIGGIDAIGDIGDIGGIDVIGDSGAIEGVDDIEGIDDIEDMDDMEGVRGIEGTDGLEGIDAAEDIKDVEAPDRSEAGDSSDEGEDAGEISAKDRKKVEKEIDRALRKTFGRPFSWKREVLSWVAMFVIAFALAFVIDNYLIVNATVPTGSMQNTIMAGDRMIGWRLSYLFSEPERGDIIIFEYPDNPEEIYVKRVIGLPGETVTITDGKIYINDSTEPLEEDYLPEEWVWKNSGYTFIVPEDSYLCLGDNRNNSHDARSWTNTYVTKDAILGRAILCYWPMEDFGWLN